MCRQRRPRAAAAWRGGPRRPQAGDAAPSPGCNTNGLACNGWRVPGRCRGCHMPVLPSLLGGAPPPAGWSAGRLLLHRPLNRLHEPLLACQAPQGACSCLHNESACLLLARTGCDGANCAPMSLGCTDRGWQGEMWLPSILMMALLRSARSQHGVHEAAHPSERLLTITASSFAHYAARRSASYSTALGPIDIAQQRDPTSTEQSSKSSSRQPPCCFGRCSSRCPPCCTARAPPSPPRRACAAWRS